MIEGIASRIGVELDAETKEKVANEQLRMVWAHAAVGTLIATAFAVVMALHLRGSVELGLVQLWIAMKLLVAAPRVVQGQIFRRRGFPGGSGWRQATYWLLALDGAVWGIAGLWLMGSDINTASLVTASLCCVACVATFGLQVSKVATAAYVVPIVVPMVIGMLVRADQFGIYGGIGLSLFLVQLLITASRSDAKLSEVFLLRIHAARISVEKAQALELVQRQSAVKSQFLGTVSHELRTPIHGMLGVARLVHVETMDPLVKKRMELIEGSGTHLLGLVTDLLDISRIESGQMRIQRIAFDLSSEVERVADIYAVRAAEKGLAFTMDSHLTGSTWVVGDPVRTRQVLHNLLGNAMKFTHKGWVHLMVRPGALPGQVHFEVRDTGVGISEEDQKIVFNAFRQVGSHAEGRRQGTGLGLTIAHEIAHLLGGDITLKSKPGFGSIFDFSAQFEAGSRAVGSSGPTRRSGARRHRGLRAHPAGRGQRRERADCRIDAGQPGPSGRARGRRRRSGASGAPRDRPSRSDPDGLRDAVDGRLRGDPLDPRSGGRDGPVARSDHRALGADRRGHRAQLDRGRHGRRARQTVLRRGPAQDHAAVARAARKRAPGRARRRHPTRLS